jgi:phage terminase large subunit
MIQALPQFKPVWERYRYKVGFSGRGGAKSFHFGLALTNIASKAPIKFMCLREFQNSIDDSSKAQIEEIIEKSGTWKAWNIANNYIEHKVTGSLIKFKGLQHVESIKSSTDFDGAWLEEAETMSQHSWNLLDPTLRKNGSQIWFTGNPRDRLAPLAQLFIENTPPPSTVIINSSYLDNRYCPQTLIDSANHLKATNPQLYRHIYLGEYLDVGNLIMVPHVKRGSYIDQHRPKCVIGVDIAKDGGDKTVICIRIGRYIAEIREFATMDDKMLVHQLQALIGKYKPFQINIDSTGHGAWVPEMLAGYNIKVKGVNFSASAKDPAKYSNMRTGLYGAANTYFQKGGTIPVNATDLERQLVASYYTLDNRNRVKMLPKDEVKRRIGCSPDQADAFVLSLLCEGDMFEDTSLEDSIDDLVFAQELMNQGMFNRR